MGLDVYLVHKTDEYAAGEKANEDFEKAMEPVHADMTRRFGEKYFDSQEYKEARVRERIRFFGDSEAWLHPATSHIDSQIDSAKYPEHMFKIGYFRSSYNDGGINRIMSDAGLLTLDEIFAVNGGHEYEVRPDWAAARRRACDTLASYQAVARVFRSFFVGPNPFGQQEIVDSPAQAIDRANQAFAQHSTPDSLMGDGWSSMAGNFYPTGMKIVAILIGKQSFPFNSNHSEFGVYVVHEQDQEGRAWYAQALEIVIETCDFVLAQPDPERWVLHWSG